MDQNEFEFIVGDFIIKLVTVVIHLFGFYVLYKISKPVLGWFIFG